MNEPKLKPTVAITLDDLDRDLARDLARAKTAQGWDQQAVTRIVRKYYGFLGDSITAMVLPRHPSRRDAVETLAVVLNSESTASTTCSGTESTVS